MPLIDDILELGLMPTYSTPQNSGFFWTDNSTTYIFQNPIEFKPNVAYHAETREEAIRLLNEAHRQGFKWNNGDSYLSGDNWNHYGSSTCYVINEGYCSPKIYLEASNYYIIKVKDLFNLKNINKDEIQKENSTNRKPKGRGTACISRRRQQGAVGSRPKGNPQSAKVRRARVERVKISRNPRLCSYD